MAPKELEFTQRSLAQEGKDEALVPEVAVFWKEISRVLATCSKDSSQGSEGQQ